jgi:hypothetical protein
MQTANVTNRTQPSPLAHCTLSPSQISGATLLRSILLAPSQPIEDMIASSQSPTDLARTSESSPPHVHSLPKVSPNYSSENGIAKTVSRLRLEIISDRDKLFISHFWTTLPHCTSLPASNSKCDSASERTNKMVIQCIRFTVERDQRGWTRALPKVKFDIMNTLNKSTGFTLFQLRFGKSPRILPPLIEYSHGTNTDSASFTAKSLIEQMQPIKLAAKDNLLMAKISQAQLANRHRSMHFPFRTGEHVVLSMAHLGLFTVLYNGYGRINYGSRQGQPYRCPYRMFVCQISNGTGRALHGRSRTYYG